MENKENWYVEVVRRAGDYTVESVEKTLGPMEKKKAEKVLDGLGRNLNWDRFYVRTVQK